MENKLRYQFTGEQFKSLDGGDRQVFERCFKSYDTNCDYSMDTNEFKNLLKDIGLVRNVGETQDQEVQTLLKKYDTNNDGKIQWNEFVDMMVSLRGKDIGTQKFDEKNIKDEEVAAFSNTLNDIMTKNQYWGLDNEHKNTQIDPNDKESLFKHLKSGEYMCDLVHTIEKDCGILLKTVNRGQPGTFKEMENLNMGIQSAKSMGIKLVGIDWTSFNNMRSPHLVLGFVWQAVRLCLTKAIDLRRCPELYNLLEEGEDISLLQRMKAEDILIRWVNYHLKAAGQERRIKNLGKDLKDSFAYTHLLNQIDNKSCSLKALDESDNLKKAAMVLDNASKMGVPRVVEPRHICSGNEKINTLFLSYIFNTKHGLPPLDFDLDIDWDEEGTVEERQFRFWINSLDIDGVDVTNLYDDVQSGMLLCKVADKVHPGCINWKHTVNPPRHSFDQTGNNGEFLRACKAKNPEGLGLKMICIGGANLAQGFKMDTLASVWALCKESYKKVIGDQTEKDIVNWANELAAGKDLDGKGAVQPIRSMKDKSLGDGRFLMHMLSAIDGRSVRWDLMMDGDTEEGKENNAKLFMSIARKLNALIFCVWDQIVNVHPKQMFILFCTLAELQKTHHNYYKSK